MIYLKLFVSFLRIGLFTIGGGYASLPLIREQVVLANNWLTMNEFADIVTIAEMTPGPIAINAATFVGTRVCGPLGAIAATVGSVVPSFIIVLILCAIYKKYRSLKAIDGILSGLRPAVVGLIAAAGSSIAIHSLWADEVISLHPDFIALAIIAVGFAVLRTWKPSPIIVMLAAGAVGGIVYTFI